MKESDVRSISMPAIDKQASAALTVCGFADTTEEARELIDMLGIDRAGVAAYRGDAPGQVPPAPLTVSRAPDGSV